MVISRKARVPRTCTLWLSDHYVTNYVTNTVGKLLKANFLASRTQPLWKIYPAIQDWDPMTGCDSYVTVHGSQNQRSSTAKSSKGVSICFPSTSSKYFFAITIATVTLASRNILLRIATLVSETTWLTTCSNSIFAILVSLSAGVYLDFWLVDSVIQ